MATFGWVLLGLSLLLYLGSCVWLVLAQVIYVYTPRKVIDQTPSDIGLEFESLQLQVEDNTVIGAWFIPADKKKCTGDVVLFCHGNGGNRGNAMGVVRKFHDFGVDVLIFDYRGYAESKEKLTEQGTYKDVMACWKYLKENKGFLGENIVVFGRSLGGAVAAWLAERVDCKALIIESTFTSAPDMASRMFPFLPTKLLCRFKYNTLSRIGNIDCPILMGHSRVDKVVPYRHAERLFAAASEPRQLLEFAGGHNVVALETDENFQKAFLTVIANNP